MRLDKMKRIALTCVMLGIIAGFYQGSMALTVCAEEYEYDELNRVTKVIYDDGSYVEYIYDKNGNIIEAIVSTDISEDSSDQAVESDKHSESNEPTPPGNPAESSNPSEASKPTESSNPSESSTPSEASKPAGSGNPSESSKPAGSDKPEQVTDSLWQAESIKKNVEDFAVLVKELMEQLIYLENLVERITEFAQNSFTNQ